MQIPISPCLHQHLLLSIFCIITVLVGVNDISLICISLMTMMLSISSCVYCSLVISFEFKLFLFFFFIFSVFHHNINFVLFLVISVLFYELSKHIKY